ncbi:hypothetical protein [Clostridium massiliamazoniense]|uniref:hypothetical protein n=1 Tax=Clostridium massiliamazoniense TaxID=1347366 RepID=UPI0006D78B8C|nr:hypothetical protein [Clostridium massiliamazoniense]
MIITQFIQEISLLLLLGVFYVYYLYKKNFKKKNKVPVIKPYYLMNKKELKELNKEVTDNINLRNKVYNNFNLMINNHSISAQAILEITQFINEDLKLDIEKFQSDIHFIYHCLDREYISNLTLYTINTLLEVETKMFFSNKSKSIQKIRSIKKKSKVINLYS